MADKYTDITARIVAHLEAGVRPWSKGWIGSGGTNRRALRGNGQPYRGINAFLLRMTQMERGFSSPYWVTFKGALALGGNVRKGARSEPAFYAGSGSSMTDGKDGMAEERYFRFLRTYRVFNAAECDGLPAHMQPQPAPAPINPDEPVLEGHDFISHSQAKITHGGGQAYYQPSTDSIALPYFHHFKSAGHYYGTAFHELAHWTGADHRLNRRLSMEKMAYAGEELVAELTSAFLCGDLGIEVEVRDDHAAYMANYIAWLKADSRAIFVASAAAEKAATYLHALQPGYVKPVYEGDVGK